MAINLQSVYNSIVAELGQGTGPNKLNSAFPVAVTRALAQLESRANTGTEPPIVTGISQTLTGYKARHEYVVYSGTMYYLMRSGFKPGDPRIATASLKDTKDLWNSAIGDYIADKSMERMDEGDRDVANLGYVGQEDVDNREDE